MPCSWYPSAPMPSPGCSSPALWNLHYKARSVCCLCTPLLFSCCFWHFCSLPQKTALFLGLFSSQSLQLLALVDTWLPFFESFTALSFGGLSVSHAPCCEQWGGDGVFTSSSICLPLPFSGSQLFQFTRFASIPYCISELLSGWIWFKS